MKEQNQFYDHLMSVAKQDGIQKVVVGGVVRNKQGKILLLTRKPDDFMPSIDELPSGNLEQGENIHDGLLREIAEETGMNVAQIQGYINHFDYLSGSGKKARQYNFAITPDKEEVTLSEHDEYKWQTIDETRANENLTPEVKKTIEIYQFNEQMREQMQKKTSFIIQSTKQNGKERNT